MKLKEKEKKNRLQSLNYEDDKEALHSKERKENESKSVRNWMDRCIFVGESN